MQVFQKKMGLLSRSLFVVATLCLAGTAYAGTEVVRYFGIDGHMRPHGYVVTQVFPNTEAALDGILCGDVIEAVNGQRIVDYYQLVGDLDAARLSPNTTAMLLVKRNGQFITICAELD